MRIFVGSLFGLRKTGQLVALTGGLACVFFYPLRMSKDSVTKVKECRSARLQMNPTVGGIVSLGCARFPTAVREAWNDCGRLVCAGITEYVDPASSPALRSQVVPDFIQSRRGIFALGSFFFRFFFCSFFPA